MIIRKKIVSQEIEWIDHEKGLFNEIVDNRYYFFGIMYRNDIGVIKHDYNPEDNEKKTVGFGR